MSTPEPLYKLSVDDYLCGEWESDIRHEYIAGETYAMVGASDRHGLIALNLATALRPAVRGTPCQVFMTDMKLRLSMAPFGAGEEVFYYPDLLVSCDPQDRATYYRTRPCLIVEVLSETTQRIDRREKWLAYTTLESPREYLILSQDRREADLYRREDGWRARRITAGAVPLSCLDLEVSLDVIYEDVPLPGC